MATCDRERLEQESLERYSRQLLTRGWSSAMQEQLAEYSIAVASSLPSCAIYLAASGVGELRILSSYGSNRLTEELVDEINQLNPDCQVIEGATSSRELNALIWSSSEPISDPDSLQASVRLELIEKNYGGWQFLADGNSAIDKAEFHLPVYGPDPLHLTAGAFAAAWLLRHIS